METLQRQEHADAEHDSSEYNANSVNAFDEKSDHGFSISSNGSKLTPVQELKGKISFARLLEKDGHVIKRRGRNQMLCCPFHTDRTPSFCVYDDDERARCYGCGWYGDIFNYEMDYRKVDFFTALQRLEKKAKHFLKTGDARPAVPRSSRQKKLDMLHHAQDTRKQQEAAQYLADNAWLCEMIAGKRNWQTSTIQSLANDGSLGWYQGALAFNYSTGMKLRDWPHRQFLWEFGGPSLWRSDKIGSAQRIMVCEGETDAITLVDLGLEADHKVAVVALPSATSIPSDITTIMQGMDVVLCLDKDEAGEMATDELCDLLQPVCSKLSILNFGEVCHE